MRLNVGAYFFKFLGTLMLASSAWAQQVPDCLPANTMGHFLRVDQSMPGGEDRVGSNGNFGPGAGQYNSNPVDFKMTFWVDRTVKVRWIRLRNGIDNQFWSTREEPASSGAQGLNPLLVVGPNGAVNNQYVDSFELEGGITYSLYAQPEKATRLDGDSVLDVFLVGCEESAPPPVAAAPEAVKTRSEPLKLTDADNDFNKFTSQEPESQGSRVETKAPVRLPLSSLIRQGKLSHQPAPAVPVKPEVKKAAAPLPVVSEPVRAPASLPVRVPVMSDVMKSTPDQKVVEPTQEVQVPQKPAIKPPDSHVILNCRFEACP